MRWERKNLTVAKRIVNKKRAEHVVISQHHLKE
jgi:hypothetical protein